MKPETKKDLNDWKDFMLYLAKVLSLVIAGVLFLGMVVWPPIEKALIDFANK